MKSQISCVIESFGQQSMRYLGIFDPDHKRLHTLKPFGEYGVTSPVVVGTLIYAVSLSAAKGFKQIVLIDGLSGQVVARGQCDGGAERIVFLPQSGMIALIGGWSEVWFHDAQTLAHIWTSRPRAVIGAKGAIELLPDDLAIRDEPRDTARPQKIAVEGPDGLVRMPMVNPHASGIFQIDPKARRFRVVTLDAGAQDRAFNGGFVSISPDGKWGVRENVDLRVEPYDRPDGPHGKWLRVTRFFELWDLPSGRKGPLIAAAKEPVRILHNDYQATMGYVDWLRRSGRSRGLFGIFGRVGKPSPASPHAPRANLIGDHVHFHWEPDSQAVWLVRRYSMMRADLTGATGALVFPDCGLGDAQRAALSGRADGVDLGTGETYPVAKGCHPVRSITLPKPGFVRIDLAGDMIDLPIPYGPADAKGPFLHYPKLTAKDISAHLPALVTVKGWKQEAVDAALTTLTERIATDLAGLVAGDDLAIVFRSGNSFYDEWEFFDRLLQKGLANASVLRPLLTAFCDAAEGERWGFGGEKWPMSGALNALAQTDDHCHEILRRFCLLRHGTYETYARDEVLAGFVKRTQSQSIESLRLAVFFVFLRDQDGRFTMGDDGEPVYPWAAMGSLDAARGLMTPEGFVELVRTEAAYWQGGRPEEPVFAGLVKTLDTENEWDAKVTSLMSVSAGWNQL